MSGPSINMQRNLWNRIKTICEWTRFKRYVLLAELLTKCIICVCHTIHREIVYRLWYRHCLWFSYNVYSILIQVVLCISHAQTAIHFISIFILFLFFAFYSRISFKLTQKPFQRNIFMCGIGKKSKSKIWYFVCGT